MINQVNKKHVYAYDEFTFGKTAMQYLKCGFKGENVPFEGETGVRGDGG